MTDLETMCESVAEDMRDCDAYAEEWSDGILDIEVHGHYGAGRGFTWDRVELTVSIGGPNIYVDVFDSGELTVRGYWGSESVTRGGRASDSLLDICEEISDARVTS